MLAGILAARADLDGAVAKAAMTGDPIHYLLAACSGALGAFGSGIQALQQPLDTLRFERAVERLERAAGRGANQRAAELAKAHNWRTLLIYGGLFTASVLAAMGGGFFWGQATANASVHQTEQRLAAAFQGGPAAAASWANLMRSNDVSLALAGCTGAGVRVIEGRRACGVPLWLDPPSLSAPGAK